MNAVAIFTVTSQIMNINLERNGACAIKLIEMNKQMNRKREYQQWQFQ